VGPTRTDGRWRCDIDSRGWRLWHRWAAPLVCLGLILAACGGGDAGDGTRSLSLYTTVTQDTVDAVVSLFEQANPGVMVKVFRAPTGELTARIAGEQRSGGLQADVLWLTDPLSMQQYDAEGILLRWNPDNARYVSGDYQGDSFVGTRILNLVMVGRPGNSLSNWEDLLEVSGGIALPDPGFAGSAFAALAYFAQAEAYGFDFYRRLKQAGAVQVQAPGDVVNGVAEGQYGAGITLSRTAAAAISDGSPLEVVWPSSGAIAIYSPMAVVSDTDSVALAKELVDFTLSLDAQRAIAGTGWQPVRSDVKWDSQGASVTFDWASAFDHQQELLDQYRSIFGG
jgi:iron(III) transport system substrate-binding protein